MGDKSIKLAPWVSYRNYFFDTQESRSIISNEKAHTFLLLEGEAASIFAKLTSACSYGELLEYAEEIGVSEELEDFIAQLFQEGLLIIDDVYFVPGQAQDGVFDTAYSGQAIKGDKYEEFIRDMNKWAWSKGLLLSAHWDMTYNCNENCIHCYNRCFNTDKNNSKELTTEEAFAMIDNMLEAGVFILTLSGGEAALRQDYFDILGYARSKRMCVQLLSNGLIWDADFSKKVAFYWPNMVGISIYSANPVLHDKITRVPGSFEASVAALKYLKEAGIQTELRSVQMRETLKGYENTKKLADELGIKSVISISIMPALDGNLQPVDESANTFNELVVLAATKGTPLSVEYIKNAFDESGKPKDMEHSVCAVGKYSLHFDPTGNINPCVTIPMVIGNIRDINLKKFFLNSLDLEYIRSIKLKNIEPCGKEAYCKYCLKVCPGSSFLEKGSLFIAPEVSCLEAKARKMAAELLAQGLSRDEICAKLYIPVEFGYI